jgi:hypothetical protein
MALATIPSSSVQSSTGFAAKITLKRLVTCSLPQGPGRLPLRFFYHFLNIETAAACGVSFPQSTAFLLAGALTVGAYFDRDTPTKARSGGWRMRYSRRRNWARTVGRLYLYGWRPESGFCHTAIRLRRGFAALHP